MTQKPTVGVLVTNYDSWDLALRCVEANLSLHGGALDRVVLLDDCSPTPPPFASDGRFEIIVNERNLGFAANLNQGVALMGTDIVLIFDADAYPLHPYLDILKTEFASQPDLALVGFSTVGEGGKATPSSDKEPNAWSLILGQALYARFQEPLERREERICLWLCALAVRRAAFEELGGFDEKFDLLDVDIDLSVRVNRSRWSLKLHPNLSAFHQGGGTPMLLSRRLLRFYANRWRLLRKHHKMKSPRLCKAAILLRLRLEFALLRLFGRVLFRDEAVRRDKFEGRQMIIRYCQQHYR